jgi:hypothetical protein
MTTEMMEKIAHNGQIARQQTKIRKIVRKQEKSLKRIIKKTLRLEIITYYYLLLLTNHSFKSGQLRKQDAKNIGLIRI